VCITTNQPENKSNRNQNHNPTTTCKQHSTKYSHMSYVSSEIHTRQCCCIVIRPTTVRCHCQTARYISWHLCELQISTTSQSLCTARLAVSLSVSSTKILKLQAVVKFAFFAHRIYDKQICKILHYIRLAVSALCNSLRSFHYVLWHISDTCAVRRHSVNSYLERFSSDNVQCSNTSNRLCASRSG